MLSPEERLKTIREQVDAKIHWGDSRAEVTSWLAQKHGLTGAEAEQMLNHAYRARHAALRERAMIRLPLAILGMLVAGITLYVRYGRGTDLFSGMALILTLVLLVVGIVSVATFARCVGELMGKDDTRSLD